MPQTPGEALIRGRSMTAGSVDMRWNAFDSMRILMLIIRPGNLKWSVHLREAKVWCIAGISNA